MGKQSAAENIVAVVESFHVKPKWAQKELADHLEIDVRSVRNILEEFMKKKRIPFERKVDHPNVIWELPKSWVPGGAVIPTSMLHKLIRVLLRSTDSADRDDILMYLVACLPLKAQPNLTTEDIETKGHTKEEDEMLGAAESSLAKRLPMSVRYDSTTPGAATEDGNVAARDQKKSQPRLLSVQRIFPGVPAYLLAHCHRHNELRWFRVSRIRTAREDKNVKYVRQTKAAADEHIKNSIGFYHGGGDPVLNAFSVRFPEADWVAESLPSPMVATKTKTGIDVEVTVPGVPAVARYVVGLGPAATVHTPELRAAVQRLANGALESLAR